MLPFIRPSLSNLKTISTPSANEDTSHSSLHLQASVPVKSNTCEELWNEFPPVSPEIWQSQNSTINIAGITISGGYIYVGNSLTGRHDNSTDPCLIDPTLPITAQNNPLPIQPTQPKPDYRQLSPEQRSHYLQWLSSDRNQPDIESGYILLYLCGLERRLLIDGPRERFATHEKLSILKELQRLIHIYGDRPEIFTPIYRLMCFSWIYEKSPQSNDPIPDFIDFGTPECQPFFSWLLAKYIAQHRPVPAMVFLYWYQHHPDFGIKGTAKAFPELFAQIFQQRFAREFGPGMILSPNKTTLTINYTACNPAIGQICIQYPGFCDVFLDKTFLTHLPPVIDAIRNDLDPLLEYIRTNGHDSTDPGVIARLPAELFIQNAYAQNLKNQIDQILVDNNGMTLLNVQSLYTAIGHSSPTQVLSRIQLDNWDKLLSRLGYLYAPNYRLHGVPLDKDGIIVISRSKSQPELSRPFATMAVILRLGAMIAQTDNEISQKEIDVLQNMIHARKILNSAEHESLILWLHWCLNTPQHLSDIERKLEKLPQPMIEHLSRVLVSVACADGQIDTRERNHLIEIYYKLGIPSTQVDEDIQACLNGEFDKAPPSKHHKDEPDENADESRIETKRLDSITISLNLNKMLSSICSDSDSNMTDVFQKDIPEDHRELFDFDTNHIQFLREIIEYPEIQRLKFFSIAVNHCLMADRVIQKVNSWAMAHGTTAFMTDGEFTVKIDSERLKQHLPSKN